MNFQNTLVVKSNSIVLSDFTPMEFRCVASQDKLKPGDNVVVVYLTQIGQGNSIPLEIPFIIKAEKFQYYIDRLLNMMTSKADSETTPAVLPQEAALPIGEAVAVVKVDTPAPENPA